MSTVSTYSAPELVDVLAAVNAFRAEHAIGEPLTEMPKGRRNEACHCPLTVALGVYILNDFANAFDSGAYPELVA